MDMIILAQINDDVLSGFLTQIPTSLVLMVCGSGLLLFLVFAWFVYFKPLYKKRREKEMLEAEKNVSPPPAPVAPSTPAPVVPPPAQPVIDLDDSDDDLPDLGLLVGEEIPVAPVVDVVPEPVAVVAPPEPIAPVIPVPSAPVVPHVVGRNDASRLDTGHLFNGEPVLNIVRDERDGRLVVVMDGVAYRSLAGKDALKKQFVDIMRDLNQVVTQPDDNPPTGEPMPLEDVAPATPYLGEGVPGKLPSFRMEDHMTPTNKGSYEVTSIPELNLAESIEAYLQHKIRNTPAYRARVIHVLPAIGGGVRIQVDDVYYEAVSDVADADVRGFIQEAIQEWQTLNS